MSATTKKEMTRRSIVLGETALMFTKRDESDARPLSEHMAVSVKGLVVEGKPTFEECERVGKQLVVTERAMQFLLGDYINYMEERWGERAAQVIDFSDGWSEETCRKYAWVAKRITPDRRRMDRLGIKHHFLVANLSPSLQTKWLTRAAADNDEKPWTYAKLKAAMDDAGELPMLYGVTAFAKSETDQAKMHDVLEANGWTAKTFVKRASGKRVES